MTRLPLDTIRLDGGTQPRSKIDEKTVARYAAAMRAGDTFPPVTVFHDGADHWLADGFHRLRAVARMGAVEIDAQVRQGALRDAVLFSVSANMAHGVRRTAGDSRRAVLVLLGDPEWSGWSNCEIARRCGCVESYVRSLRKGGASSHSAKMRTVTRKGSTFQQDTSRIGKSAPSARPPKGRIAKDAFQPVLGHSEPPAMVGLSLPKANADMAASTLIELFETDWLRTLVERIARHLESITAK